MLPLPARTGSVNCSTRSAEGATFAPSSAGRSAVAEVMETRASKSRPELGIVRFRFTVTNQSGEAVMTMENPIMFATREAAA